MALRTEREVLNHLIESCRDGELGFTTAAEHLADSQLKSVFLQLSAKRAQNAHELLPHAQRLGGPPVADRSTAAAVHRKWIDLKSAFAHDNDHAIVVEAVRGDSRTVHAYKSALEGNLPPDTRDVVERQYDAVEKEHAWLAAVQTGHGAY